MTASVVQTASTSGSGSTLSVSFSALPEAGNSVIVACTSRQPVTFTASDNQSGNTYSSVSAIDYASGGVSCAILWLPSVVGRSGTFTVTATLSTSSPGSVTIMEVSGLSGFDKSGTLGQAAGTSLTVTASAANSQAADMVVAVLSSGYEGSSTTTSSPPSASFTSAYFTDPGSTPNNQVASVAYKFTTGGETSSATWTSSTAWNGVCACLATFTETVVVSGQSCGLPFALGNVL